jgi:alpha-ketoglutarate-dependent taurine dioxygenase
MKPVEAEDVIRNVGSEELLKFACEKVGAGLVDFLNDSEEILFNGDGFCVLDTELHTVNPEEAKVALAGIASFFGTLSPTDVKDGRIVWHITPQNKTDYSFKTFSETDLEAQLHTDSQYRTRPEDVFLLGCMVSDEFGKGTNTILKSESLINAMQEIYGSEAVEILKQPFPFRVPTVFTGTGDEGQPEVIWAPIIKDDERMRFRADTIQAALELPYINITDDQAFVFQALRDVVWNHDLQYRHLYPGQVLLVDNWRVLHGRTAFTNQQRLLHRIRVHKDDQK